MSEEERKAILGAAIILSVYIFVRLIVDEFSRHEAMLYDLADRIERLTRVPAQAGI